MRKSWTDVPFSRDLRTILVLSMMANAGTPAHARLDAQCCPQWLTPPGNPGHFIRFRQEQRLWIKGAPELGQSAIQKALDQVGLESESSLSCMPAKLERC